MAAAAEKLFLSQSALSHTMTKLEDYFDTPLWTREGRNLRFTRAGEYLPRSRLDSGRSWSTPKRSSSRSRPDGGGTLRIGMECYPCYQWLLGVAAPYMETWQTVDVDVKAEVPVRRASALCG